MMVATGDQGVRLNFAVEGRDDAPVLLMMHSIGCDLALWDAQIAALAADFRIIRYDARGHGGSDAPTGDYTVEQLGRDALAVLDAAGAATAWLCGLSLGALTAMHLALTTPERVRGLILANTGIRIGTAEAWQGRADAALRGGMAAMADIAMSRFFSDPFRAAEPRTVDRFRAILTNTAPHGYAGGCAVLRDADFAGKMGGIAAPTIVIGGTLDIPTPLSGARELAEAIPGARLVALEAGHLSSVEQPAGFAEAVRGVVIRSDCNLATRR
jgi:3-oxoadipate enol-lactonase